MWGELLRDLVRAFLLLRDFFGYLLPGAAFLYVVALSQHASVSSLTLGHTFSTWGTAVLLLGASYVAGHLLATIGHAIQDITSLAFVAARKYAASLLGFGGRKEHKKTSMAEVRSLTGFPVKSEYLVLYYRRQYPQLFIEVDRRDTLALLRTGLGASFFVGSWLFPLSLQQGILVLIGVVFLLSGYVGRRHVALYRVATLRAALRADKVQKQAPEVQSQSTQ